MIFCTLTHLGSGAYQPSEMVATASTSSRLAATIGSEAVTSAPILRRLRLKQYYSPVTLKLTISRVNSAANREGGGAKLQRSHVGMPAPPDAATTARLLAPNVPAKPRPAGTAAIFVCRWLPPLSMRSWHGVPSCIALKTVPLRQGLPLDSALMAAGGALSPGTSCQVLDNRLDSTGEIQLRVRAIPRARDGRLGSGGGGSNKRASVAALSGWASVWALPITGKSGEMLPPPPQQPQIRFGNGLEPVELYIHDGRVIVQQILSGGGGHVGSREAGTSTSSNDGVRDTSVRSSSSLTLLNCALGELWAWEAACSVLASSSASESSSSAAAAVPTSSSAAEKDSINRNRRSSRRSSSDAGSGRNKRGCGVALCLRVAAHCVLVPGGGRALLQPHPAITSSAHDDMGGGEQVPAAVPPPPPPPPSPSSSSSSPTVDVFFSMSNDDAQQAVATLEKLVRAQLPSTCARWTACRPRYWPSVFSASRSGPAPPLMRGNPLRADLKLGE